MVSQVMKSLNLWWCFKICWFIYEVTLFKEESDTWM